MVFSTAGAFLLVLAEPRGVAEAEAFKATGNYDKVLDLTHVPVEFDSLLNFGLTSITTCLEFTNVLLVNFILSTGSSISLYFPYPNV
jgi:hypothetical protein